MSDQKTGRRSGGKRHLAVEDVGLGAKVVVDARELECDVSTAHYGQLGGQLGQVQDVIADDGVLSTWDGWHHRASPRRYQNIARLLISCNASISTAGMPGLPVPLKLPATISSPTQVPAQRRKASSMREDLNNEQRAMQCACGQDVCSALTPCFFQQHASNVQSSLMSRSAGRIDSR